MKNRPKNKNTNTSRGSQVRKDKKERVQLFQGLHVVLTNVWQFYDGLGDVVGWQHPLLLQVMEMEKCSFRVDGNRSSENESTLLLLRRFLNEASHQRRVKGK